MSLSFARAHGFDVSIRGSAHNAGGLGLVDDGLVIDLSSLRNVDVDPRARTARVGGGATLADVDHATHAFGLAARPTFGSPPGP